MADGKKKNDGFRAGFMADMLRNLEDELGIEKKRKGDSKRGRLPKKPADPKGKTESSCASPAGPAAQGTTLPEGTPSQVTAMPVIHVAQVTDEVNPRRGQVLLGIYRVESKPIKGGMGAVWRVHHTGWDVDLAMKRPHPEAFRTEAQKQNFTQECRYWMNLGLHPHIVSCYYVREIGGIPTIFSEWMENGSLESHIKGRTLYDGTAEEVQRRLLDIAIQFARGLHYAHENGLIHQDVKPDNLLLTGEWFAKVSDFGLAKARTMLSFPDAMATDPETDENATMVSPGGGRTPAYCSPEQAAAQLLTRRTDIYSWAVSVLEMYLGDKPWAHGRELTGPLVGAVCRDYFDMCTERPVPEALQELLAKCMETDPDDRPQNFSEVEDTLLKIYRDETGSRYPLPEAKGARDTADSLNNKAISHLDLGEEEEAAALLESCARLHHFDGTLNLALYRWRKGLVSDKYFFHTLDDLENPFWERRDELASIRKQIYLEACGMPQAPVFRLVTPQGFDGASLSSIRVIDGKLLAVVRKRWRDGNEYYYVCHFDVDTGALLQQYPWDHEQPGIPCPDNRNNANLFDGGRLMYLDSGRTGERAVFDVISQRRVHEYDDHSFGADRFVTRSFSIDRVFTGKGEILPDFMDGIPMVGKKTDGDRVYEIIRAATWKPCARVAARELTWLKDAQFLIRTARDTFLLYDAEKNSALLLFSRGRQDGQTVLKDSSKKIVVIPNDARNSRIYEYRPGCFVLRIYGRFFTLPDLQEPETGSFRERAVPEPRTASMNYKPYEFIVKEVLSERSLLTLQIPVLPKLNGKMNTIYRLLKDRSGGYALVYHAEHQVAWAVTHIDFCPSHTQQLRYRISKPVTTAVVQKWDYVDQQRLSEFRSAQRGNSLRDMIAVYRDAVFDDHTGYETLHTMNTVLSSCCMKFRLLYAIGAPDGYFRESYVPSVFKEMKEKRAFSPTGRRYVTCEDDRLKLWEYPSGKCLSTFNPRLLSNPCDDTYAMKSLCMGRKDEIYISYTCFRSQNGGYEKDYRVACLGNNFDRDETVLLLPGGEQSRIFLLGTAEDNRYLLLCRDDGKIPNTVSLELLDLDSREVVSGFVINDIVREGEAFLCNDTLSMLSGKKGAIELLWDYEPFPLEMTASDTQAPISFQIENGTLIRYFGEAGKDSVIIPYGITEIGPEAFKGCELIRSVTIPDGVRVIGDEAFWGCSRLEEVRIHSSTLEHIGKAAFAACVKLENFNMIDSRLRTVSEKLFSGSRKLQKIELPKGIREIGASAFAYSGLKAINLPFSMKKIGKEAFAHSELERLLLPEGLTSLGEGAFMSCSLTAVRIPVSVDTLPENIFDNCRKLEIVENEGSIRTIGSNAFHYCVRLRSVQVAPGTSIDLNSIFGDTLELAKRQPAGVVSITEPTPIHAYIRDPYQNRKVSLYNVTFVPAQ